MKRSNRQIGDRPKTQVSIRMDADLVEAVEAIASKEETTKVSVIESALQQYIEAKCYLHE